MQKFKPSIIYILTTTAILLLNRRLPKLPQILGRTQQNRRRSKPLLQRTKTNLHLHPKHLLIYVQLTISKNKRQRKMR